MRKLLFLLLLMSLFIVTGVYAQDDSATEEPTEEPEIEWVCPEGFEGQTLNFYNWATYIGETTISTFEELCGVTVVYDVYDSNEAMIARLRQGNPGYDIAIPSDYAIAIMIRDGLLQPINMENIPNLVNVSERWHDLFFDPTNEYSVPYLWGDLGVAYNVDAVGEEITSWTQVWEYDGEVAWMDDPRSMLGIALQILGYDPNSQNPDEIAEARDYLLDHSDNVKTIAADDGQAQLARGEVDIAVEYNGDVYQIIADCACDDYAFVLPEEGAVLDIAALVLLKDAPNPELATVFMDYILDPVVGALIVNDIWYPTANQAAIDSGLIDESLLNNQAIFPPDETLTNAFFANDVGGEAEQAFNDAWDEILIFAGG